MSVRSAMRWWGWGHSDAEPSPEFEALLRESLGVDLAAVHHPVALEDVELPAERLRSGDLEALRLAAGEEAVRTDRLDRVVHAAGRSYTDLVRLRSGLLAAAPDAVVHASDEAAVQRVVSTCADIDAALIPFGGGTSVVGGVTPEAGAHRAVVTLDVSGMRHIHGVEPAAMVARADPGLRGAELEQHLRSLGMFLGHYPQSFEFATLGGYAAARSAGQASTGIGRFDELVVGLRCITPAGIVELDSPTPSATGPDLRPVLIGSEGGLGIITRLDLRIRHLPTARWYEAWSFATFEEGYSALRLIAQQHRTPDVARLSDADETRISLAAAGAGWMQQMAWSWLRRRGQTEPCLAILGWEGSPEDVTARRRAALPHLRSCGGLRLGRRAGDAWRRQRFRTPYLRDPLLDRGVLVETLETSARWGDVHRLHEAVSAALRAALAEPGSRPLVGCHLSHLYTEGASLYFTVMAPQSVGDELEQWQRAKRAATDAIVANGGTLSHHHGLGREHVAWLPEQLGPVGVELMGAIKQQLDPAGIMNPGTLFPAPAATAAAR